MKKYLYGLVALILLSLVVTRQYEYYAQKNAPVCKANGSSTVSPDDTEQAKCDTENAKRNSPGWYVAFAIFGWPTGITVWALVLTMVVVAEQASLTRQAIASSDVASKAELRAYIGVTINGACYQDRLNGIKFEGIPTVINTGKTPAHRVRYRDNISVIREPLPSDYVFAQGRAEVGEYVIGMSQPMLMHIVMDEFVDQQDVASIMSGTDNRAVYYWGKFTYEDAFGDPHETDFCHRIYFVPDLNRPGEYKVMGTYIAGRNKAT